MSSSDVETVETPEGPPVRLTGRTAMWLSIVSGVLMAFSHPGFSMWPLAWVALAPALYSVTEAPGPVRALWRGYLFGFAYLGAVWYWVGLTVNAWTQNLVGWLVWFALTALMAWFFAMWAGVAWWLHRRILCAGRSGWIELVSLAASWVAVEYLRHIGDLAAPWAPLSYSQGRSLPVIQFADITGAWGISFLIVLFNAALVYWWRRRSQKGADRFLWHTGIIVGVVCLYGVVRLMQPETGKSVPVAAMQAGFNSLASDFNLSKPPSEEAQYGTFERLTAEAMRNPLRPAICVWAESAAPRDALDTRRQRPFFIALARRSGAAIVTGSTGNELIAERRRLRDGEPDGPWERFDPGSRGMPRDHIGGVSSSRTNGYETRVTDVSANMSVLFDPVTGVNPTHYVKRQLVPFGEFIPFRGIIPDSIQRAFGFSPYDDMVGSSVQPLVYSDPVYGRIDIGPFICWETIFPRCAREMTAAGATLLVTQSNDSWFQSRAAMEQHLSSVVLRAVENHRCVVQSTTTGITCFVDNHGRITGELPLNREGVGVQAVRLHSDRSIYTLVGDWFVLVCFAEIGRIVWVTRKRRVER